VIVKVARLAPDDERRDVLCDYSQERLRQDLVVRGAGLCRESGEIVKDNWRDELIHRNLDRWAIEDGPPIQARSDWC
jgi:hypothetical protein